MHPVSTIFPVNISDKSSVLATCFKETTCCYLLCFLLLESSLIGMIRNLKINQKIIIMYLGHFFNWLQAYWIFSSVLAERKPDLCGGLFQHLEHVLKAYKNFGGMGWFQYDESFCQKWFIYPSLSWGMKDIGLWLNLIVPQKPPMPKQNTFGNVTSGSKRGFSFAFNKSV